MEKLIQQCQQGDREAMGQLYTVMHDELLAQCRKYAASDNDAEDLLHDAFLLIFSHIDKVHSPEKGRRWMHKVARNVCLLYVQHRQNHALLSIDDVHEAAQGAEPDMALTYNDILSAIDLLPHGYRQVFRLSVLEGLTHQQIAELTGIEPHTSSSQLLRAKRHLRQLLQVLMFLLLAAIPFGGYYFWSLQNGKHGVAEVSETTPTDTQKLQKTEMADYIKASTQQKQSPDQHDSAEHEQARPSAKAQENEKTEEDIMIAEEIVVKEDTAVKEGAVRAEETVVKEGVVVAENNEAEQATEPIHKNETAPMTETIPNMEPVPDTNKDDYLFLSLAYSKLPDGTARQLPYGTEGANGDIDSVAHHRLPMTVALNARYRLGAHWWLDGGLRYTLLSSETRVGNTYLFMEQQQRVRYLGLSLGVGHDFWHRHHWNLYGTSSVFYDLPLRSTTETSFWQDSRLIDTENIRLTPHVQWSIGAGIGLQYNLTPTIGIFAEPSLQYYFHNSDGLNTWRTDHTFTPTLPFGIRILFK